MNVAFLFNSDDESLGSIYGITIMKKILEKKVLHNCNRHMRISIGDILTFSAAANSNDKTFTHLEQICNSVYIPKNFNHLKINELKKLYTSATIFCWLFQNMTEDIATKLDNSLKSDKTYLGAMDVNFSYGPQLALFRNSLVENYSFYNNTFNIFYNLGLNESEDTYLEEIFKKYGYDVNYEDIGARRTIFDNYDTLEHFQRIEDFKNVFTKIKKLDDDLISDIIYFIEELHPKLFDIFASASRALERAETEEDYAQIALSGRRFLEKLADYLFPPSDVPYNGRNVGNDKFKNRIWAYIEKTIAEYKKDITCLDILGKEADRLLDLFNKGLHLYLNKNELENAFSDLIIWLYNLITLSPEAIKRPYLAYEDQLEEFVNSIILEK